MTRALKKVQPLAPKHAGNFSLVSPPISPDTQRKQQFDLFTKRPLEETIAHSWTQLEQVHHPPALEDNHGPKHVNLQFHGWHLSSISVTHTVSDRICRDMTMPQRSHALYF